MEILLNILIPVIFIGGILWTTVGFCIAYCLLLDGRIQTTKHMVFIGLICGPIAFLMMAGMMGYNWLCDVLNKF